MKTSTMHHSPPGLKQELFFPHVRILISYGANAGSCGNVAHTHCQPDAFSSLHAFSSLEVPTMHIGLALGL